MPKPEEPNVFIPKKVNTARGVDWDFPLMSLLFLEREKTDRKLTQTPRSAC